MNQSNTIVTNNNSLNNKKISKKNGQRLGYYYIIYKSLKESLKNDVVKCFYIKSFLNFGFCVIKEGAYGDSKDKHDRDITDRLKWQHTLHKELQGKVRIPKLIDVFEENGNYYLVIEMIRGVSFNKYLKKNKTGVQNNVLKNKHNALKTLGYLLQINLILTRLHEEQVVHRDATPANFIIGYNGKVSLIDLELSYSLKLQAPNPVYILGTYGYMASEQIAANMPTTNEDIFAFGAILLYAWTGISPAKITEGTYDDVRTRVKFLIQDREISSIVSLCFHSNPSSRPSLQQIYLAISNYEKDIKKNNARSNNLPEKYSPGRVEDVIQKALLTLSSPCMSDENGWFSSDLANPHDHNQKINKAYYASFGHGVSGIIYLLCKAKESGFDTSAAYNLILNGIDRIEKKYIQNPDQPKEGLLNGSDGIAATLAAVIKTNLLDATPKFNDWIDLLLAQKSDTYNISSGIAGQGYANMLCSNQSNKSAERINQYIHSLLSSQRKDGSWIRPDSNDPKRITRGFFNGVAGIVHFLLTSAHLLQDDIILNAAEKGLKWLIHQSFKKDGNLQWKSANGNSLDAWWEEGSPGIALAFIKGYEVTQNKLYKKYATESLYSNPINFIHENLGLQRGLSGLGEIYLEAKRVLGDAIWQERANWIVQVLMHLKLENPKHGIYWLVGDERQAIPGFMRGNSGLIHFLLRYCDNRIELPLISIHN